MYKVEVPGSLMLLGEHAVLYGQPAIVGAISQKISAELIPRIDNKILIDSDRIGKYETDLNSLSVEKPFHFVLASILIFKDKLKTGFNLYITSEFSDKIGFGSSAAVTAATISVFGKYLQLKFSKNEIFDLGKQVILDIQKQGSCADLAASIYGGVIKYNASTTSIEQLRSVPHLVAVYCGYKKPTPEVLEIVRNKYDAEPEYFNYLFNAIGKCVNESALAINSSNMDMLGKIFITHQKLIEKCGVSNSDLDGLIDDLYSMPEIYGAKISGSGLGDCVIGLGTLKDKTFPKDDRQKNLGVCQFNLSISKDGLCYCE